MLPKLFKNNPGKGQDKVNGGKNRAKKEDRELEDFLVDAIDYYEQGKYYEASKQFSLIANAFPEHPLVHLMLARSYLELKKYEQSIWSLLNHLRVIPDSVEARLYLGLAYYECGELERAQDRFQEALELKKDSLLVKENMAIIQIDKGELEEALFELENLHRERPNDSNIIQLIVLTLGRLGKWEIAKQYANKLEGHSVNVG